MPAHSRRIVYLDHAAATPIDPMVLKAMEPFLKSRFENPSSLSSGAQVARNAIESARKAVASAVGSTPDTIVFTSGGTEANNLAIIGAARANAKRGRHLITSAIEHPSVLEPMCYLAKNGWTLTVLPVTREGLVKPEEVRRALRPDTTVVSIMYANNEIGTIQPISDIGRAIFSFHKQHSTLVPYFHTDACQATPYLDLHVEKLHVDLLTANAEKMYGPKGAGFLYVRRGIALEPLLLGGGQETNLRSGTENTAAIVGLGKALTLVQATKDGESKRLSALAGLFAAELKKAIPRALLIGPAIGEARLPNNVYVAIDGLDAETVLIYLNERGVVAATGSACSTSQLSDSHVLKAIGEPESRRHSGLRFSLGKSTTKADVLKTVRELTAVLTLLRN